jgi:hypothetical protein
MTLRKYKQMFKCDAVRIASYSGKMFLVIGWNRNTQQDTGQWTNGKVPIHFDYLVERVVANGRTKAELLASAKEYQRVSKLSPFDYLDELVKDRT